MRESCIATLTFLRARFLIIVISLLAAAVTRNDSITVIVCVPLLVGSLPPHRFLAEDPSTNSPYYLGNHPLSAARGRPTPLYHADAAHVAGEHHSQWWRRWILFSSAYSTRAAIVAAARATVSASPFAWRNAADTVLRDTAWISASAPAAPIATANADHLRHRAVIQRRRRAPSSPL